MHYNRSSDALHQGAPLIIHPGRKPESPFQILDILEAAGADISRTVMSHLDRTIFDDEQLLQFAKRGSYLEYDLFGIECSYYQVSVITQQLTRSHIILLQFDPSIDMPSDAQRIKMVKLLVDHGYQQRIMLAHDIHTKHRLVSCYHGSHH